MRGWLLAGALLAACGAQERGEGSVVVSVDGEAASREGWPVTVDGETIGFVDGWSLSFEAVVLSVDRFRLATWEGDEAAIDPDPVVVDLHRGIPTAWTFDGVPARRWDRVSYDYVPATDAARNVNGVDGARIDAMIGAGATMLVAGTATDGAETLSFEWALPVRVRNGRCHDARDDTDGLVVRAGGVTEASLTIHLDHLFFDTYATDEAEMRFEAIAAVADPDGTIPLDALADQELADLRGRDGEPIRRADGTPLVYDPGPLALAEPNLREYVLAAATTTGHFNGEGHCEYTRDP